MTKLIFSIAAAGFAGAVFFMYTQQAYDSAQATQRDIDQYNQALNKAAELQQLKQTLLSRYNAFNPNDLDRLQKLLPDHVDNVRLVLDLDNLASRYGLALQNVVISNPASEKSAIAGVSSIGAGKQKYDSLSLKFSTSGPYDRFVQFLQDLESSLRVVDLVSLSISPLGALSTPASASGEPLYRFDITIRTYWLK